MADQPTSECQAGADVIGLEPRIVLQNDYNRTSPTGLLNFTGDYLPSSNFVAITAVPEPSTLVLMAIGAGLAAVAARRRAFVR